MNPETAIRLKEIQDRLDTNAYFVNPHSDANVTEDLRYLLDMIAQRESQMEQLKKKVKFWNDPAIPIRMVGETCERCPATDCAERVAEPIVLIKEQRLSVMKTALNALSAM